MSSSRGGLPSALEPGAPFLIAYGYPWPGVVPMSNGRYSSTSTPDRTSLHARRGYPMVMQPPHPLAFPLYDSSQSSCSASRHQSSTYSSSSKSMSLSPPFTNISNASHDSPSQSPLILLGSTSSALLCVTRPSASSPDHQLWILGSTPTRGVYSEWTPLQLELAPPSTPSHQRQQPPTPSSVSSSSPPLSPSPPSRSLLSNFRITHLACGKKHALLLTSLGQVFSFGAGHLGQLGHGDDKGRQNPTEVAFFSSEGGGGIGPMRGGGNSRRVVDVAAGGGHSIAVVRYFSPAPSSSSSSEAPPPSPSISHDEVYAWGFNHAGQLGVGDQSSSVLSPRLVRFREASARGGGGGGGRPAAGGSRAAADGPNGEGKDEGRGGGRVITGVALGAAHSLLLTSEGRVYSFGGGTFGRLGINGSPPQQQMAAGNAADVKRTGGGADNMLEEEEGNIYNPKCMELQRELQRNGGRLGPETTLTAARKPPSYHEEYLGVSTTASSASATAVQQQLRRPPPPGPPPPSADPSKPPPPTGAVPLPSLSTSQIQHGGSSIPTPIRFTVVTPSQPPPFGAASAVGKTTSSSSDSSSSSRLVPSPPPVAWLVSCGDNHSVALLSTGFPTNSSSLYSWGFGHDGQMSNGTWLHLRSPRRMGDLHNYLDRRRDLRPASRPKAPIWERIESSKCATDVKALWSAGGHGALLTVGGNVVTWGDGAGGWLGHPFPYLKLKKRGETTLEYVYDVDAMEEVEPGPPRQQKILRARTFESDYNLFIGKEVKVVKGLRKEGIRIADGSGGTARKGWRKWLVDIEGGSVGHTHMCLVARLIKKSDGESELDGKAESKDDGSIEEMSDEESSSDDDFSQSEDDGDGDWDEGVDSKIQAKKAGMVGSLSAKGDDEDEDDDEEAIDISSLSPQELQKPSAQLVEVMFSLCRHDRRSKVLRLLSLGYSPVATDLSFGNTLLHVACQNGNLAVCRAVLRSGGGADVNARNKAGNTPLHFAMYYKHEEIKDLLIAEGADDTVCNNEGLTPWEGLRADELDDI